MAAATRYKKFLKLCERWPLDPSKTDRDLGLHIRQRVSAAFQQGESSHVSDERWCDRTYDALDRIAKDEARRTFYRSKTSSASGLTLEACKIATSSQGLDMLQSDSRSRMEKVKDFLSWSKRT